MYNHISASVLADTYNRPNLVLYTNHNLFGFSFFISMSLSYIFEKQTNTQIKNRNRNRNRNRIKKVNIEQNTKLWKYDGKLELDPFLIFSNFLVLHFFICSLIATPTPSDQNKVKIR